MQIKALCSVVYGMGKGVARALPVLARKLRCHTKTVTIMKMTIILLTFSFLQVSATSIGQRLSMSVKNEPLEEVFRKIEQQTDYRFIYLQKNLLNLGGVSLQVSNIPLQQLLDLCLKNLPLTYTIDEKTIVIKTNEYKTVTAAPDFLPISGIIVNATDQPLQGVNIQVKNTSTGVISDAYGHFSLNAEPGSILVISSVGYATREITVKVGMQWRITMEVSVSTLDETVIIAYGTTTKRKSTSSVSSITADDIAKQPVANPLNALQGRIAGAVVTQSNGLPGSNVSVLIRGNGSLGQGTIPLYIVDGVMFNILNQSIPVNNAVNSNTFSGANGSISPFSMINPADIERIDILKDADATAIYGTRGANGVVLITTKKAKAGKTKTDLNFYQGVGKVSHFMDVLNLPEYLALRKKALANDGLTPTAGNAPDLFNYDTTGTDWQKKYIGGTAKTTDAQVTVSGGDSRTRFLLGAGYHRETTVFPGDMSDQRLSVRFNADHSSLNKKFNATLSAMYSYDQTNLISADLSTLYTLPPNYKLYNTNGSLFWDPNFTNPQAQLLNTYLSKMNNLITNMQLRYSILPGLDLKTSLSFAKIGANQNLQTPISAQNPSIAPANNARFGIIDQQSYTVEPQLTYTKNISSGVLTVLAGGAWQRSLNTTVSIAGNNYNNPGLLASITGAATYSTSGTYTLYKYNSFFGRLNYAWKEKYIINGNLRRDGSSRFGPDNRFGTFGSVGGAWVMSNEPFFREAAPAVSFAKLRASYGLTGNDQFTDYQFLATYSPGSAANAYQGTSILSPSSNVANPYLQWETNKKMEFGLDLGFFADRLLLTANYYRNRSENQLSYVTLPTQTGYNSYSANFSALLQNKGFEFEVTSKNIVSRNFTWKTSFNLTIPRNQLLSVNSTYFYASTYKLGESVSQIQRYTYKGVDPATGRPLYRDALKDSLTFTPNFSNDRSLVGNTDQKAYGGISNDFQYKNWSLSFFFQGMVQDGNIYPAGTQTGPGQPGAPGALGNVHRFWLEGNMWQQAGDNADLPKATTLSTVYGNAGSSDFSWGNNSYLKLRNVSLSYNLPSAISEKIKMSNLRVYMQAQNLHTWTKNVVTYDPETGTSMPPLRVITFGINCSL